MHSRTTFVAEIQRLLTGEQADPRPAQAIFLVPVLADMLVRLASGVGFDRYFVMGSLVALVPTVGALAIGTGLASRRWTLLLPVLDITALAVYRLSPETALGVAVAFPAIWLGLQFGRRGIVVTVVTITLTYVVTTPFILGVHVDGMSRIVQALLFALIASSVVAGTAEMWREKNEEANANAARLEGALRDAADHRRFAQTIFDGVDVGLVAIDAEGNFESANPKQIELMRLAFPDGHSGFAGQEGYVFGADGITPLTRAELPTILCVNGEVLHDYLVWVGRDPDTRRALAISSTPHYDVEGRFAGAVLSYHDITELMMAARIKEEFVASVSHELRTPLTSIIGYVDVLLDDTEDLPEEVRHYLGTVQRNARRLHRLVDDLLSTALQSVASVLDVSPVSVTHLLHLCGLEAAKAATVAGLSFELEDTGSLGELCMSGDAERLSQVFDNLFSNALKYTPRGGRVTGGARHEGDEVVVWVRDNGRGIDTSDVDRVFSKFYRSASVQGDAIPGVGLGLAISKTIVESHGGSISVRSELGQGSTFEVRLPLTARVAPRVEYRVGAEVPASLPAASGAV
jgi:two-component system phosphate regulon sensor histidine kinase PhoR